MNKTVKVQWIHTNKKKACIIQMNNKKYYIQFYDNSTYVYDVTDNKNRFRMYKTDETVSTRQQAIDFVTEFMVNQIL